MVWQFVVAYMWRKLWSYLHSYLNSPRRKSLFIYIWQHYWHDILPFNCFMKILIWTRIPRIGCVTWQNRSQTWQFCQIISPAKGYLITFLQPISSLWVSYRSKLKAYQLVFSGKFNKKKTSSPMSNDRSPGSQHNVWRHHNLWCSKTSYSELETVIKNIFKHSR